MKILLLIALAVLISGCARVELVKNTGVYTIDKTPVGYVMKDI